MAGYAPFLHFINPLHVTSNLAIHSQSASLLATGRAPLAAALAWTALSPKERQTNGLPAPWGHNIFAIKICHQVLTHQYVSVPSGSGIY